MKQTEFPFWLLERCASLEKLCLAGEFEKDDIDQACDSTPARLKSLVLRVSLPSSSPNWIELCINQLESLTISPLSVNPTAFPVLLGASWILPFHIRNVGL